MKNMMQAHFRWASMERKWIIPLAFSSLISLFLLVLSLNARSISSHNTVQFILSNLPFREVLGPSKPVFVESKIAAPPPPPAFRTPRLAYLISGSKGDGKRLKRTLAALYHPLNQYIVHLDLESPPQERLDLADHVRTNPVFAEMDNVYMITKANMVTYKGPTMVSNTLHAAAVLLRRNKEWDWFINLSASDYPLVTQDDLLHTFSSLPRDLNFIEHTSRLGWKEFQRARPVIIDPGLYMSKKSDIFWVTERRDSPTAFKLFTGYSDSDWAGDIDDRKSTAGYIFSFGSSPIVWQSKKMNTLALSTTEAEYRALVEAGKEALWIKSFMAEIGFPLQQSIMLNVDNQGAISIATNPVGHSRTKHVELHLHFIRNHVHDGTFQFVYCPSEKQVADILTKSLTDVKFSILKDLLGMANVIIKGGFG